jgi:hypothetical protein
MILTAVVWLYMYIKRLGYIASNNIDAAKVATPEQQNALLPAGVNNPSNNLKNLFELPVLFYVLSLVLFLSVMVDLTFYYSAWAYVGLRVLHSIVQCTVNNVNLRFGVYLISSLVLWFMVFRAGLVILM